MLIPDMNLRGVSLTPGAAVNCRFRPHLVALHGDGFVKHDLRRLPGYVYVDIISEERSSTRYNLAYIVEAKSHTQ